MEDNNLTFLIVGEPTHLVENILDLAWSNIVGSLAWVQAEECMTSDHLPILRTLSSHSMKSVPSRYQLNVPTIKLPQFGQLVSQWIQPSYVINSTKDMDYCTGNIFKVMTNAVRAVENDQIS